MKNLLVALLLLSFSAFADVDKKTERTFKAKCSACHGVDGKGQTEKGRKMKIVDFTSPEFKKKSDTELKKAITDGVDKKVEGVEKIMDPYKDELTPEQIDSLVRLIRSLGT